MYKKALALLQKMLGEEAKFRPGQWEAIETIVGKKERILLVQRTGWGKSIVYFLATKLLRLQGAGPTLLISPLLALMRNQIEMATRIGIQAFTIHSGNRDEWTAAETALADDACDVLLISPERLANQHFINNTLPTMQGRIGLFVVDEAHCISDWGHDFRPDYRRITRILQLLPSGMPVLSTTATANNRVIDDITSQLGADLKILRGPLTRDTLRLQNLIIPEQSHRLAWLAETINALYTRFNHSGVIYCLTVADTERVAQWLQSQGINAEAYSGKLENSKRERLEQALINNEVQALVATVALGMGFDKPDLGFVIHFQKPNSVVAYYQQVGRAGRAIDRAYGILLSGSEDQEIHQHFIDTAFPSAKIMLTILETLEENEQLSRRELLDKINIQKSTAEKALKLLEVDGAIGVTDDRQRRFFRTPNPWKPNSERVQEITNLRYSELEQVNAYVDYSGCLMEYLGRALDDPLITPCGICANCQGRGFEPSASTELIAKAHEFLSLNPMGIEPRKWLPKDIIPGVKTHIPEEHQIRPGYALCHYGDSGWGIAVRVGKYEADSFSDDLVEAAAKFIRSRWQPNPFPTWVTAIPSLKRPHLVYDFSNRLAQMLELPFQSVLVRKMKTPEQKTMHNSYMQAQNVYKSLIIEGEAAISPESVLLIDDIVDSRWTMTIAGWLLRSHGSGPVFPFALAFAGVGS